MAKRSVLIVVLCCFCIAALSGCQLIFFAKKTKDRSGIIRDNFANDRLINLTIVKKATGKKNFLLFKLTKTSSFLEGYIQGMVTDYDGRAIEGVIVRAIPAGFSVGEEGNHRAPDSDALQYKGFDPGITNNEGLYQIRFSVPLAKGVVDMRGQLQYNPGWEQALARLGQVYQPQMSESSFRLYFNKRNGIAAFDDGMPRTLVHSTKDTSIGKPSGEIAPVRAAPVGRSKTTPSQPSRPTDADDIFKSFGFGD